MCRENTNAIYRSCAVQKQSNTTDEDGVQRVFSRWEKPRKGWTKLNVDATVFKSMGKVGLGCVLGGDLGGYLMARSCPIHLRLQAYDAEAMSVAQGFRQIQH